MFERSDRSRNEAGGRKRRSCRRSALVALFLGGMSAAPSLAQEVEPVDPRAGFSGFIEAAPQVSIQKGRGSVQTTFGTNERKANVLTSMTFRLGGGVKGPALSEGWGRPRPVAYVAALIPLNESSTIGKSFVKVTPPGITRVQNEKFTIEYQTSATAGLGMEFMVPLLDTEIAIMPAIESIHLLGRYVGESSLTVAVLGRPDLAENHATRGKEEITQHFLGPALRVSAPTATFHGVSIDFFLHSSVLFDVAGTRKSFVATGTDADEASFNFETGTGAVQVTSGIQLRWP